MYKEIRCFCPSSKRQTEIPATILLPEGDGPWPLVLLLHGHGSYRDENVGFVRIAEALAQRGIASLRMDFPGCGESREPFTQNHLSNMKDDVMDCLAHMLSAYPVLKEKAGLFGYSMGGRAALELALEKSVHFAALSLLAPAVDLEAFESQSRRRKGF